MTFIALILARNFDILQSLDFHTLKTIFLYREQYSRIQNVGKNQQDIFPYFLRQHHFLRGQFALTYHFRFTCSINKYSKNRDVVLPSASTIFKSLFFSLNSGNKLRTSVGSVLEIFLRSLFDFNTSESLGSIGTTKHSNLSLR